IVITRNEDWNYEGVEVVHTLEDAIQKAKDLGVKEIFVIGGAEIFHAAFPHAQRLYLTRIHHSFDGDVFFKGMKEGEWKQVKNRFCKADEKNLYDHSFQVWERFKL